MSEEAPPLLKMDGVSKNFGGVTALREVHFDLRAGEVHSLMGENGAGKSTLMKILAGVHQPDAGTIRIDGKTVTVGSPAEAAAHGIAIIHQELNTVPDMTVAENLALGREPTSRGVLDRRALLQQAHEKLQRIRANVDPRLPMRRLSVGMQQMVEIARAVAEDARVLILDEPTAALSETEAQRLFTLIEEMREQGIGLIYISHRMEEVWRLSDRITVFRDGQYIATSDRGELTPEAVVKQMIGREVDDLYVRDDHAFGEPALEVRGLTGRGGIGPVDLTVHAGEVVGLVGLIGAGRTEIARLIAGADRATGGTIMVGGKRVSNSSPEAGIRHGIGMLPESRKEQALFPDLSIRDNIVAASLGRFTRFGTLQRRKIAREVAKRVESLRIRSSSTNQLVRTLSGGNQQKVVLARWLTVGPKVLILDEPTRGVDIGAKHEIYRMINEQARKGIAILVVSSDLPEALGVSDRVLVVRDGQIAKELAWEDADEETVMLHATGVASDSPDTHEAPRHEGVQP